MVEGLAVGGVVLAIPGIIDLTIKYGVFLTQLFNHARDSSQEQQFQARNLQKQINDIRFEVELLDKKPEVFQKYFQGELEDLFRILSDLYRRLSILNTIHPIAWAFFKEKDFRKFVSEIDKFHGQFRAKFMLFTFGAIDITAFDTVKWSPDASSSSLARLVVDLRQSIKDRQEESRKQIGSLRKAFSEIPSTTKAISGAELSILPTKSEGYMIVEERSYSTKFELTKSENRILDVASMLHKRNDDDKNLLGSMGIPHCMGYAFETVDDLQNMGVARLRLVYHTPYDTPRMLSLRDILNQKPMFALNDRVELAKTLARAVYFTHVSQFVHKDIRPGNVLICDPDTDQKQRFPIALGSAFLVGFSDSRRSAAASQAISTKATERDLYQHPSRLSGPSKQPVPHNFVHDMFSLGVCLLEIGLWQSTVKSSSNKKEPWIFNPGWAFLPKEGSERMEGYKQIANGQLSGIMGRRYAEVVINCLTYAGEDTTRRSSAIPVGFTTGIWYVEHVLTMLGEIAL